MAMRYQAPPPHLQYAMDVDTSSIVIDDPTIDLKEIDASFLLDPDHDVDNNNNNNNSTMPMSPHVNELLQFVKEFTFASEPPPIQEAYKKSKATTTSRPFRSIDNQTVSKKKNVEHKRATAHPSLRAKTASRFAPPSPPSQALESWAKEMHQAIQAWLHEQRNALARKEQDMQERLHTYQVALVQLEAICQELKQRLRETEQQSKETERDYQYIIKEQTKELQALHNKLLERVAPVAPQQSQQQQHEQPLTSSREEETSPQPVHQACIPSPTRWRYSPQSASRRRRFVDSQGNKVVHYSNGSKRVLRKDGTTVTTFSNGDHETKRDDSIIYYFAEAKVTQTLFPDGSKEFLFGNGQKEKHWVDGRKEILHFANKEEEEEQTTSYNPLY